MRITNMHTCKYLCLNAGISQQQFIPSYTSDYETTPEFNWDAEPIRVICAVPYILAFTRANTIEIRLIVNGNLVHTLMLPHLQHISSKVLCTICIVYFIQINNSIYIFCFNFSRMYEFLIQYCHYYPIVKIAYRQIF